MKYKLGKLDPKAHLKSIPLRSLLTEEFPAVPGKVYWEYKLDQDKLQMFRNDEVGCCTVAAVGHMIMNMTAHTGTQVTPTDEQIIEAYSKITGYDPSQTDSSGFNPTDNGAAITDVLEYWRTTGIAGHQILGWTTFDAHNHNLMQVAQYLFSAADVGVQLPAYAMQQFEDGQNWVLDLQAAARNGGIEGGHCIPFFGYGSQGSRCITWGKEQAATLAWLAQYMDESYAVISPDWFDRVDKAPNGFNKDLLWKLLKNL